MLNATWLLQKIEVAPADSWLIRNAEASKKNKICESGSVSGHFQILKEFKK
jgi:hypothetical protein